MEIRIVKDSEQVTIGFNLYSNCYSEEDFFIWNLPANLAKRRARIEVQEKMLIISNGGEGTESFEISESDARILKAYLEGEHTKSSIDLGGFGGRVAHILFKNENVRRGIGLPEVQKTRKVDISEFKKIISQLFGTNPRKAKGVLSSAYADTMQYNPCSLDVQTIEQFSVLLHACGFKNHARKIRSRCQNNVSSPDGPETRCLFAIY